jgi:hypothetical protein
MEKAEQIIDQLISLGVDYAPKVIGAIITLIIGWILGNIEAAYKHGRIENLAVPKTRVNKF